jgi:C_GCAxxG_C_C family probable redox protein
MEAKVLKSAADAKAWIEENGQAGQADLYQAGLAEEWNGLEAAGKMENWTGDLAPLLDIIRDVRLAGSWPFYSVGLVSQWIKKEKPGALGGQDIKKKIVEITNWGRQPEMVAMVMEINQNPALAEEVEKLSWMRKGYGQGYMYERDFGGCAQCTLAAVFDLLGYEEPLLFKVANGFAAGMSLYGDGVCGGYSGGTMALGMFAGRTRENFSGDRAEKDKCYAYTKRLHDRFIETYGTVICADLHKEIFGRSFCLRVVEDKPAFEAAGAHNTDKCPAVVGAASSWVAEILYDEGILTGRA